MKEEIKVEKGKGGLKFSKASTYLDIEKPEEKEKKKIVMPHERKNEKKK